MIFKNMEDTELELLMKYPLITKQKLDAFTVYKGTIQVDYTDYKIYIKEVNSKEKLHFYVDVTEEMQQYTKEIEQLSKEASNQNIITLLDGLDYILKNKNNTQETNLNNTVLVYRKVLHEYSEFIKFYIHLKTCDLSEDLKVITVSLTDESNREHCVSIKINYSNSSSSSGSEIFEIYGYDLPEITFKSNSSLLALFEQFLATIENLQPYFNFMEEIDQNCYILDPEKPTKANTYRRIWLKDNLSVLLNFNAYSIFSRPDIKFLGPELLVEEYREKLNNNLESWEGTDLFQALLNILGIDEFPEKPPESDNGQFLLKDVEECSICFSLRLNDKLPDVICNNKCCVNFFHTECLSEWLISINGKIIFNEISGACPNCEKTISCAVLDNSHE